MLGDELIDVSQVFEKLKKLSENQTAYSTLKADRIENQLNEICARAKRQWTLALFSAYDDYSIKRYYQFHLSALSLHLETLSEFQMIQSASVHYTREVITLHSSLQRELNNTVHYLIKHFPAYLDTRLTAPTFFQNEFLEQWHLETKKLVAMVRKAKAGFRLTDFLVTCFERFTIAFTSSKVTFETMLYIKNLVGSLTTAIQNRIETEPDSLIETILINLNFNDLDFFSYYVENLAEELRITKDAERIAALKRTLVKFKSLSHNPQPAFYPAFPSIGKMICGWLKEEIHQHEQSLVASIAKVETRGPKLMLTLPASYLALLLKIIHHAGWTRNSTLTDLFKLTVANLESKRMKNISLRSLSKECYSVSQQTAARVKELLQQLIGIIDRQYFPAIAVINAALFLL